MINKPIIFSSNNCTSGSSYCLMISNSVKITESSNSNHNLVKDLSFGLTHISNKCVVFNPKILMRFNSSNSNALSSFPGCYNPNSINKHKITSNQYPKNNYNSYLTTAFTTTNQSYYRTSRFTIIHNQMHKNRRLLPNSTN